MSGLHNFRDLGGMVTADGRKVVKNRLLRSAEPIALTASDLELLKTHNLARIVDLRRPLEVEGAPIDAKIEAEYILFDVMEDKPSKKAGVDAWLDSLQFATANEDMMAHYRDFITLPSAKKAFGDLVKVCAAASHGATLFHCHAGKDRTGMAAAIILKILGVSSDDILDDFLKTQADVEKRMPAMLEKYRAKGLSQDQISALEIIYGIKREYLELSFKTANEEYGSFDGFIERGLGVTKAEISTLRESYLSYN